MDTPSWQRSGPGLTGLWTARGRGPAAPGWEPSPQPSAVPQTPTGRDGRRCLRPSKRPRPSRCRPLPAALTYLAGRRHLGAAARHMTRRNGEGGAEAERPHHVTPAERCARRRGSRERGSEDGGGRAVREVRGCGGGCCGGNGERGRGAPSLVVSALPPRGTGDKETGGEGLWGVGEGGQGRVNGRGARAALTPPPALGLAPPRPSVEGP